MSKLAIFGLAALVAAASAQCDWSLVDQAACQNSNTQQDCFPPGWPTCGGAANGAGGAGGDGGQTIADILPASCNEVDFLKCFYEYPDLENYLTCVHPEPCSCAGDFKVLECANAHCTDKSEYPEVLTSNIAECRAKGKHTFVSSERHGGGGVREDARKETTAELRRRQNGPSGGLLTGEDVFPIGPSCKETTLTPCLNGLAQEYESCVDPFAPCLCSALYDIQRCYTASCTSQEDQPTIVTNNIVYCPKNETPGIGLPPPPPPPAEPTVPSTSIDVVNPSTSAEVIPPPPSSSGRAPTATIQPTGTTTLLTTTLLISYIAPAPPLPTRSPLSPITPVSTISLTSTFMSTSTSSANTYRQIELTSTTSTTTQVVVATTRSVDYKGISTSTELVPSTTVTAQTTTTSTVASTGAAATMNMEVGVGAMAAAAMGFAALL